MLQTPSTAGLLVITVILLSLLLLYGLYRDAKNQNLPYPILWPIAITAGLNLFFVPGLVVLAIYIYLRMRNNRDEETVETDPLTKANDPFLEEEIDQNADRD